MNNHPENLEAAEPTDELTAELRRLRLEDPAPDLRRRALTAGGEALAEREGAGFRGWWRELALAGAALLIFALSPPSSPTFPDLPSFPAFSSPTAMQIEAAAAELAEQLGVEEGLAGYLEKKSLAVALSRASRPSPSRYSFNDPS